MSNRRILDPVEATFRDLRGTVDTADGHAAMSAIERRPDLHAFHRVTDDRRRRIAVSTPLGAYNPDQEEVPPSALLRLEFHRPWAQPHLVGRSRPPFGTPVRAWLR